MWFMVHMFYGVESKAERLSIPLQLPLVDKLIREHRSPGASEVVVGVQNMSRGVEGVVDRKLQKLEINKYVIIGKNSKSTWKPVMAILDFS